MITEHSDVALYVMTPEYGAATQLEKIDMLDYADVVALNKFDKRGALDALRDVRKQFQRNHKLFETEVDQMPVFGTIASQFNDPGMNSLYRCLMDTIAQKTGAALGSQYASGAEMSEKIFIIPPHRNRYLSEIAENNRKYDEQAREQRKVAQRMYALSEFIEQLKESGASAELMSQLQAELLKVSADLLPKNKALVEGWSGVRSLYKAPEYVFKVRDKELRMATHTESLSHTQVPKISTPRYEAWGDLLHWQLQENVPGEFPYTAGIYPFKREGEDPTRMFAGEGGPERTNKRFHYVS